MSRAEIVEMLRAERTELAEFLGTLGPDDWDEPSLCDDWTIREVAAHLASAVGLTRLGLLGRVFRFGTGTDGANARSAAAYAKRDPQQIIDALANRDLLGVGFFQPAWALCEVVVHHQDMRRAVDRPRSIPGERLAVAIGVLVKMPYLTGRSKAQRDITIVAEDIDLTIGDGPELRGPAEAVLMTLAGRSAALSEVSGDAAELFAPTARNGT